MTMVVMNNVMNIINDVSDFRSKRKNVFRTTSVDVCNVIWSALDLCNYRQFQQRLNCQIETTISKYYYDIGRQENGYLEDFVFVCLKRNKYGVHVQKCLLTIIIIRSSKWEKKINKMTARVFSTIRIILENDVSNKISRKIIGP